MTDTECEDLLETAHGKHPGYFNLLVYEIYIIRTSTYGCWEMGLDAGKRIDATTALYMPDLSGVV